MPVSLRRRSTPAALAAALLASVALVGCRADGPFAVTASGSQRLEVAAAGDARVTIAMFNGSIRVVAGAPDRVVATVTTKGAGASKADAESDRGKIEVTLLAGPDGTVRLDAVYRPRPGSPGNRAASAEVEVPPGVELELRTSNGLVAVDGIAGPVAVDTSNGAVTLAGAAAGATVRTSNGAVTVAGGGLLDLETSNGRIDIRGDGATVRARTSNGEVSFEGTFSQDAQEMRSSNGPISVRLPADATFTLDAETSNASVTVDGFAFRASGATERGSARGAVGSGGPAITLRTGNAAIVVATR